MRLSAHDASFLYTETASGPMHGITITCLDGVPGFAAIFDFYAARIHRVPRLRQKLAFVPYNLAHPKWVDDPDFDLANHLIKYDLPANTPLSRALETGYELAEPLLDRNLPLWRTYVIENVEGKTLLVQLAHHAFVDGATLVAMSTGLTDPAPDTPAPPPEPWQPEPVPAPFALWQEAATEAARNGVVQAQQAASTLQKMPELTARAASLMQRMARPVMQAPWNASLIGPKRQVISLQHMLEEFKPIRQALGGTINDIVVAVISEAVARYLVASGESVDDQYLRIMVPVNVRPSGKEGGKDASDMSGNHVSAMFPIVAARPLGMAERFAAVRSEMDTIKQNQEVELLQQLQDLQPNLPPIALSQTLSVGTQWDPTVAAARAPLPIIPHPAGQARPQQLGFNFTCTNVPGPNWTQYIAGHRVEQVYGALMLGGNLGFGAGIGSYDGKLYFNLTADPRLIPDLNTMAAKVSETFAELKELAVAAQQG